MTSSITGRWRTLHSKPRRETTDTIGSYYIGAHILFHSTPCLASWTTNTYVKQWFSTVLTPHSGIEQVNRIDSNKFKKRQQNEHLRSVCPGKFWLHHEFGSWLIGTYCTDRHVFIKASNARSGLIPLVGNVTETFLIMISRYPHRTRT